MLQTTQGLCGQHRGTSNCGGIASLHLSCVTFSYRVNCELSTLHFLIPAPLQRWQKAPLPAVHSGGSSRHAPPHQLCCELASPVLSTDCSEACWLVLVASPYLEAVTPQSGPAASPRPGLAALAAARCWSVVFRQALQARSEAQPAALLR